MNTFVSMHKAEYMGEWFYGTHVSISKVILASQDATELLSTIAATELLLKPEAVIWILQAFGESITFRFWNIILNKELMKLVLCGDFKV